ncbi:MAG: helix-turn-helix transcriptional regulator [Trueperaceae bacterium]
METFAEWLKDAMKSRGYESLRPFAEKVGVTHTSVRGWLRGGIPDAPNCIAIAKALGVTPAEVLRLAGHPLTEWDSDAPTLTADQQRLVRAWSVATPGVKQVLRAVADLALDAESDTEGLEVAEAEATVGELTPDETADQEHAEDVARRASGQRLAGDSGSAEEERGGGRRRPRGKAGA